MYVNTVYKAVMKINIYNFTTLSVCFQPKEEFEITPTVDGTLPLPPLISLTSVPRSRASEQNVPDSSPVKTT